MPDISIEPPIEVVPKTLDDVCTLLQQILDALTITNTTVAAQGQASMGITLGGTDANEDAGEPSRVVGQRVSSGLSSNIHVA
jgi:hypothetical protein